MRSSQLSAQNHALRSAYRSRKSGPILPDLRRLGRQASRATGIQRWPPALRFTFPHPRDTIRMRRKPRFASKLPPGDEHKKRGCPVRQHLSVAAASESTKPDRCGVDGERNCASGPQSSNWADRTRAGRDVNRNRAAPCRPHGPAAPAGTACRRRSRKRSNPLFLVGSQYGSPRIHRNTGKRRLAWSPSPDGRMPDR